MHVMRCSPLVQRTVKEGRARVVSRMPTGSLQDMCVGCLVLETALGRNRVEKTQMADRVEKEDEDGKI